ncbi:TonB-linked outer membrane protein, SusC/RagA family [Flaviramulus basaltis]|uniref:TonB-linked outer membrane protein, SusC/RagA family n=1 Tax=Flaviramulus basaltis TaxID=369401 RepID=A0A1K2IJ65_9FLAO|nr:TonB-dependent receptor [Flaviramulus basaltis]SFZ92264.1 TonB-linked outer membrane protein, SusC/RagA family [Flaviramulus basaltis]
MKKLLIKKRSPHQQLLRFDLKMKLSALFILVTLFTLHANNSYSQRTKVSLNLDNVTVEQLIDEIENKTDFRFVYKIKDVNLKRLITLKADKELITSVLNKVFLNTNTSYNVLDKQVFLTKKEESTTPEEEPKKVGSNSKNISQGWSVKGIIVDSNAVPLPGASILEKGTTNGAQADFDGNFSLDVSSKNATLIISYLGYATKEVLIDGQTTLNVTLIEDTATLDEVVIIGYGSLKRTDLTGAVSSVSAESIEQSIPTSIDQVLQGRAAGVQIQQNSGAPGSTSSIRIRGISSITGTNEPIFVIDGVIISNESTGNQSPLSGINPSDIVSLDILKDASATAIYGSRAANGVIMITTKRGKKGESTINFDSSLGWQEIPKKLSLLNLEEYAIHSNTRAELNIINQNGNFIRPDLLGEGTDWQDELFVKAMIQNYNLSFSGGSDKTTYSMGIGYLDQEGIAFGSSFERLTLRSVIDSQVKDYLKAGVNLAFNNSKQITTVSDGALIPIALRQTPNVAVRNADGNFDGPDTNEFVQNNPIGLASIQDNRNEDARIRASIYAELTFLKGFKFKTQYSADYGFSNAYTFNPSYTFGQINRIPRESSRTKAYSKFYNLTNLLSYDNNFGVHNINVLLGQEYQEQSYENLYGYKAGFLTNTANDLVLGDDATARTTNGRQASAISSYFGRVFYSYDDKYLLTGTLRYDGSSKFTKENRWGLFPSAALAWKISNENFLKDNASINDLKLRLGWGVVGNQDVPNYAYTSLYGASATNQGTGLLPSNTANPDLKWETTYSSNIGFDIGLFNNRIKLSADLYYKKTEDLLLDLALPAYSGTSGVGSTSPPIVNIGSLENKGIELSLNTLNSESDDFSWSSNFVFSINKNKVLSLNSENGVYDQDLREGSETTIVTRTAIGQPIGQFYGYKVIGRFEDATDFYYKNEAGDIVPTPIPEGTNITLDEMWIGDYIFEDINKDGVISPLDRTYIGNPAADFTFGIGNTFTYQGFDLNIFLTGSYGNEVVNYQRRFLENPRGNTNLFKSALGYAQLALIDPNGPNDYRNVQIVGGDPYMPRIARSSTASTSNFRYSDRFVEDGSYLRIQNISFGYNLPKSFVSKLGMENIKIYSNMQNVFTFTKYSGYDPEVGSINQNVLLTGIDNARYPSPQIYTIGINAKF